MARQLLLMRTKGEVTENALIKHMVGREIDNIYPKREQNHQIGEVLLEVKHWDAYNPVLGRNVLKDVNFQCQKGRDRRLCRADGLGSDRACAESVW